MKPSAPPALPDNFARAEARLGGSRPIRPAALQAVLAQLQAGRMAQAERDLTDYLAARPDDADALSLMARVAVQAGRRQQAVALLERCLAAAPEHAAARYNLAHLLGQLDRFPAALGELDQLLKRDPANPLYRQMKANVLETLGDHAQSLALFQALADENPQRAESWISLGHSLRALGRQDESVAAYRRAIACCPSFGQAYWSLANMKTVRFQADEVAAMQRELARGDLAPADRVPLQFALAKALEDLGAFEQAFGLYAQGNAAMRQRIAYTPQTLSSGVAANKALYTPVFLKQRLGSGCAAPDPIFIVGRPRSGSTLIEQILASHPAIEGTAELPYITGFAARLNQRSGPAYDGGYLRAVAGLDAAALRALGDEYMLATRRHRKLGRPHFIDKKPANFSHIGLIHLILPNARIIDARRHPGACCFSEFKAYSSKGRPRLDELGQFYRDYVALMAHFDAVLPGRVHRVHYEDLVANPEAEVRRLLDHLGLPFDEACLRFHETERAVLTPSSEQVRQPINDAAVGHWRHFEPWLGPLKTGLGSVLDAYPAVPADLSL